MSDTTGPTAAAGRRPLDVGLMLPIWTDGSHIPHWTNGQGEAGMRWSTTVANARLAESVGFDSLWVPDHFAMDEQVEPPAVDGWPQDTDAAEPPTAFWEAWSVLAGLAVATARPKLGTLVTCAGYRNPAFLAKIADTVDEMSGGRVILGVGAGDHWGEHERYGLAWDQPIGRFEEALQIIAPLLRDGRVDFEGRHHRARGAVLMPRGPRAAGPPILIGALGTGPRMLRLVATYADLWNGWYVFEETDPRDEITLALERLDAACELHGRDPATLGRTIGVSVGLDGAPAHGGSLRGPASAIADRLRELAELGIEQVQVVLAPSGPRGIEAFAEVLDRLDTDR